MMNLGDSFPTPGDFGLLISQNPGFEPMDLKLGIDLTPQHAHARSFLILLPFNPACALPASAGLFPFSNRIAFLKKAAVRDSQP